MAGEQSDLSANLGLFSTGFSLR